jgi:hypothetical protein
MRRVLSVAGVLAVAAIGIASWYSYVLMGRNRYTKGTYAGRKPGDIYPR